MQGRPSYFLHQLSPVELGRGKEMGHGLFGLCETLCIDDVV